MKFIKSIIVNPKKRFFRSDPPSSFTSSSHSSTHNTPTSLLPSSDPQLLQAFKLVDTDNDGMVSREDLAALLSRLGGRDDVETMLSEVVDNDVGFISIEELISRIGSTWESPAWDEEIREAFTFFDRDSDGRITAEELLGFFGKVLGDARCTLEECQRMVAAVDRKGEGFVCFEDFSRMMDLHLFV